jgi:hypothetical protein
VERRFRRENKRKALRAADYGDARGARQADFLLDGFKKRPCGLAPTRRMLVVRAGINSALSTLSTICCAGECLAIQVVDADVIDL